MAARRLPVFAFAALVGLASFAALASPVGIEIGGVTFVDRIANGPAPLELRGAGVLRWRGLIRAYAAALYLAPGNGSVTALDDVPKRLEIEYFRSIDAADFGRAADVLLARTLTPEQFGSLRARLDTLHASYEAVEPGDRYALTYFPGIGTELSKNGRPLAVVAGFDFAAAYFSMWLGDEPMDSRLRDALLTQPSERARN